ncbi:MAG: zf-HC2 domain-containing protein [Candidatus Omnitrophota bacterium]
MISALGGSRGCDIRGLHWFSFYTMNCDEIKTIIPAYIKHTAAEDEISKVEEHLCVCNECREFLGQTMDRPNTAEEKKETLPEIPIKNDSNLLEYIMVVIGIAILFFFLFLLFKR